MSSTAADIPSLRQRNPPASSPAPAPAPKDKEKEDAKEAPKKTPQQLLKEEDAPPSFTISLLEVLRTIAFLLVVSCSLSYLVTRESYFWNVKRPNWSKGEFVKAFFTGPLYLTDAELLQYNGEDPTKPIYLAINGTIYDVTVGAKHYGPKGSYHFFAGHDGSRGFVTGCFDSDVTGDMRGVEKMFLPLDDAETDALVEKAVGGQAAMKDLREQEAIHAKKEVHKSLDHWVKFFAGSGKYPEVGKMKRGKNWEKTLGEERELCQKAEAGRKKRKIPE